MNEAMVRYRPSWKGTAGSISRCGGWVFGWLGVTAMVVMLGGGMLRAEEQARWVMCRFLTLNRNDPPPPLLNVAGKDHAVRCSVHTHDLSPAVKCLAVGKKLAFVIAADRQPAAVATLPDRGSEFIVVFVATQGAELPWRIFVIEDSFETVPDGGIFVANFHSQDIRFKVGESEIRLPSTRCRALPLPAKLDAFNMAPIVFEFQQGQQWRTIHDSMLRFVPGLRYLVFGYVDPSSGRPKIVTYQDHTKPANAPTSDRG